MVLLRHLGAHHHQYEITHVHLIRSYVHVCPYEKLMKYRGDSHKVGILLIVTRLSGGLPELFSLITILDPYLRI